MTKEELAEYISSNYGADGEYPWAAYPHYSVFRHAGNKKWFAVIMKLPASKVVPGGEGERYFVNLKTDPQALGSLLSGTGIYRAYHMNKTHWLTADIENSDPELLLFLLERSFDLTGGR